MYQLNALHSWSLVYFSKKKYKKKYKIMFIHIDSCTLSVQDLFDKRHFFLFIILHLTKKITKIIPLYKEKFSKHLISIFKSQN